MTEPTKRNAVVTIRVEAAREDVWKAWSDPAMVMRWWGPDYFSCPVCEIDFREGGTTLVAMRGPAGTEWDRNLYNTWTYRKILPVESIEFVQNPADQHGMQVDPVTLGLRTDFPTDVRTVVTLKSVGTGTEMTVTEYGFPDSEMFVQAEMGLAQTLKKLAGLFG